MKSSSLGRSAFMVAVLSALATPAYASDETAAPGRTLKNVTFSEVHHPLSLSTIPFGRHISDFVVDSAVKLPAGKTHFEFSSAVTYVSFSHQSVPTYLGWRYFDTSACASNDDPCQLKTAEEQCLKMKFEEKVLWKRAGTDAFVEVFNRGFRGYWTSGIGAHCGPKAAASYSNDSRAKAALQGYGKVPAGPAVDVYRTVVEAGLSSSVNLTDPPTTHWMVKSEMLAL